MSVTFALLYSFVGVMLAADLFMSAIERITSQVVSKAVRVDGGVRHFTVMVWNPTVANLTLMALGSSAPEILLSTIEIVTSGFYAGELGPSTIVGSAAFNLLVISAVCVFAIPDGAGRLIKELGVFAYTGSFSVFAYIWLIIMLRVISPNIVEVWEGVTTFLFFPALVWLAYCADIGRSPFPLFEQDDALAATGHGRVVGIANNGKPLTLDAVHKVASELSAKVPEAAEAESAQIANALLGNSRSRAYYRVKASRDATGGRKVGQTASTAALEKLLGEGVAGQPRMGFEPEGGAVEFKEVAFAVRESDKWAEAVVVRSGNAELAASVKYRTEEGTASAGSDFKHTEGVLQFR
eukprot:2269959-Prymnesium_polylepis.1